MSEPTMPESSVANAHADATVAAAAAAATAGAGATNAGAPSQGFAVYAEKEPSKTARMRPQAVAGGAVLTGDARGARAQCDDASSASSGEAGGGGICSGGRPNGRAVTRLLIVGWDRVRSYIMITLLLLFVIWAAVFFPLIIN